ncbi:MAG: nucleotide exchange factor GrpE [Betaproteobacteria bacterium]|jgi:molecular chaperone GrpE
MTEEKNEVPNLEQDPDSTTPANPEISHEQQVNQLTQLLNESKDAFLRAKAEAENVRRRAVDDVAKAHKFAIESFAEHLLPVMDSMHAALQHHNEDLQKLKEGVELTLKQLSGALEKGKVIEIHPEVGAKFDPHLHQAISMVESDQEANTVVSVLQKGYLIAERVLRPALVTVSQPK